MAAEKHWSHPASNDSVLATTLVNVVVYQKFQNITRKCINSSSRFLHTFVVMTNFCLTRSYGDLFLHRCVQFLLWIEESEE